MQAEVKDAYWQIFDTEGLDTPPGPELVALIDARIDAFADKYKPLYPAAVKCLLTDHGGADRLPAVPRRAPQAHPALQLHRYL